MRNRKPLDSVSAHRHARGAAYSSPEILKAVVCPMCKGSLHRLSDRTSADGRGLHCVQCRRRYGFEDGILCLFPDPISAPSPEGEGGWTEWSVRSEELKVRLRHWTRNTMIEAAEGYGRIDDTFKLGELSGRILDVGCGVGTARTYLAPAAHYWGIDPSDWVTHNPFSFDVQEFFPGLARPFPFVRGFAEFLPFAPALFDSVLLFAALDHTHNPYTAVRECYRVLRKGGSLYVVLHADTKPPSALIAWTGLAQRGLRKMARSDWKGLWQSAVGLLRIRGHRPDHDFPKADLHHVFEGFHTDRERIIPGVVPARLLHLTKR